MDHAHNRAFFIAVGILMVVVCVAGVYAFVTPQSLPFQLPSWVPSSKSSQSATTMQTPKPAEKKVVMIELPGASAIAPLKEDYGDDSSLWRVISKEHPLTDSHYVPTNLESVTVPSRTDKSNDERSLRADIMPDVKKLFTAMKAQGYDMMIGSGYRSYDLQNFYYTNYVKTYGQSEADTFSAQPGKSEHQSGLAFDVAYISQECYISECFGDTAAGKWLQVHSYEYGFIIRYPKGKSSVTGYMYEPWHLRYVGKDLSKALYASGLTLDEAYPYLQEAITQLKDTKAIQ